MPPTVRGSNRKGPTRRSRRAAGPSRIIGAGEMADLIRGFDWANTAVGPIESWPDTLLITVNMLLASKHPMFLWWGPELIQFYNDGYRPSIRGDRHPRALGQRAVECWPEIWPIIGPQIEAVMTRGESTWNIDQLIPINRDGKLEEVFWTYSYSPVRDEDGTIRGTLVVCTESTERVLSERRLRSLLAITADLQLGPAPGDSMVALSQNIVSKLDENPADIPFAALFLVRPNEIVSGGSTSSAGSLSKPGGWPLAQVIGSQTTLLLEDLQQRCGEIVREPWPEPVTRAYLLPLALPGWSTQAVLILGVSPLLPFDNAYETFFHLVSVRISTLLQAELHQQERSLAADRFHRLAEANPSGTIIGDLQGGVKYVNPAFLRKLGYSEDELKAGRVRWDELTPPDYAEADARAVEQLRTTGRCDVYEKVYVSKDGKRIPILIGASIINTSEGNDEVAAFVTDLTPLKVAEAALRRVNDELEKKVAERTTELEAEVLDRQRAEMSLRALSGRLMRTQDEERRHMARELHDHAGQTLVALGLNLSALRMAAGDQIPEVTKLALECDQLSNDLSKEIRTLSYLLHPPLLDEAGLGSALRWYVSGFSDRSKIQVELLLPEDLGRLASDLEIVVFRVVQEGLTNIHRHSGSATARISISRSADLLEMEISDRGKGIPPERQRELITARVGVGVRGMEERVRQFKGSLKIESDENGTKVMVTLPLTAGTS